jgi:hypothetical protein
MKVLGIPVWIQMLPVWTCLENDKAPVAGNPQTKEVLCNSITEFFISYHFCIFMRSVVPCVAYFNIF